MDDIDFRTMHAECQRELKMRRHVYQRRVSEQAMTQAEADRAIGIMEAIVAHFAGLADSEQKLVDFEREQTEPRLL